MDLLYNITGLQLGYDWVICYSGRHWSHKGWCALKASHIFGVAFFFIGLMPDQDILAQLDDVAMLQKHLSLDKLSIHRVIHLVMRIFSLKLKIFSYKMLGIDFFTLLLEVKS